MTEIYYRLLNTNVIPKNDASAMKSATAEEFEEAIRGLKGEELRGLVTKSVEMYLHKDDWKGYFGGAMDAFVEACRKICNAEPGARLSKTLQIIFEQYGLTSLLRV